MAHYQDSNPYNLQTDSVENAAAAAPRSENRLPRIEKEKIDFVMQSREIARQELENQRMQRLVLMDESGQPKVDIRPDEERIIDNLSDFEKRKIVISNCGVLKYLQPFYENKWNHRTDMSMKNLKNIYTGLYLKNQEKELDRRRDLLLNQILAENDKIRSIKQVSKLGGSANFLKLVKNNSSHASTRLLPSINTPKRDLTEDSPLKQSLTSKSAKAFETGVLLNNRSSEPNVSNCTSDRQLSIGNGNKSVQFELGPEVLNSNESVFLEEARDSFGAGMRGHSPKNKVASALILESLSRQNVQGIRLIQYFQRVRVQRCSLLQIHGR